MRIRLATTATLWAIIGLAIGLGGVLGGKGLLLLTAIVATWELVGLLRKTGLIVCAPSCAIATGLILGGHFFDFASIGTSVGLIIVLIAHFSAPIATMPAALLAVLIPALGLGSLHAIYMLSDPYSLIWVIWVIAVVKFADGNAYLIGRYMGRHKLAPSISPGKTWEGLAGALLAGILLGFYGVIFPQWWVGPVLGVILAAAGSLGDMAESAIKRRAGVKDSGQILPGLGGVLDLTDSLLIAAPVAWLFLKFVVL